MHIEMTTENFSELAAHLHCDGNFESVVVNVDDEKEDEATVDVLALGTDSMVILINSYFKPFFEEVVGKESFTWETKKMTEVAGFVKSEKTVKMTIEKENIIVESFDGDGDRVERFVHPRKASTKALNNMKTFPYRLVEVSEKYPDIRSIKYSNAEAVARAKVSMSTLKKVVSRGLSWAGGGKKDTNYVPVTLTKENLNIQCGHMGDRSAGSYDGNIKTDDTEYWNDVGPIETKMTEHFLNVVKVFGTEHVFLDMTPGLYPVLVSSKKNVKVVKEVEVDGKKTNEETEGEPMYIAHYVVSPMKPKDKAKTKASSAKKGGKSKSKAKAKAKKPKKEEEDEDIELI